MKIVIKDELTPSWVYEPSYIVSVEGDFSQTQVLQIRSAVSKFVKSVQPILAETKSEPTQLQAHTTKEESDEHRP